MHTIFSNISVETPNDMQLFFEEHWSMLLLLMIIMMATIVVLSVFLIKTLNANKELSKQINSNEEKNC